MDLKKYQTSVEDTFKEEQKDYETLTLIMRLNALVGSISDLHARLIHKGKLSVVNDTVFQSEKMTDDMHEIYQLNFKQYLSDIVRNVSLICTANGWKMSDIIEE